VNLALLISMKYSPHPKPLSQKRRGALKSTSSLRELLYRIFPAGKKWQISGLIRLKNPVRRWQPPPKKCAVYTG
ncbi:hypothetical protein POG23_17705, partial [Limnoraphis robusta]|nr:hypothetical protein [Limnoraphis robusta]